MRTRIGIAVVVAVLLALPITVGLASANPYPVGRAFMYGSGGTTGISGTAFVVRQLTSNQTHVMLRLSGMKPKLPVIWQIVAGSYCGTVPTSTLLTESKPNTVSSQGTVMTTDYVAGTLNVTSGTSMMTVRVYDNTNGKIGTELACGQVYEQPSMGSNHWW